jgi:hypothetical protein
MNRHSVDFLAIPSLEREASRQLFFSSNRRQSNVLCPLEKQSFTGVISYLTANHSDAKIRKALQDEVDRHVQQSQIDLPSFAVLIDSIRENFFRSAERHEVVEMTHQNIRRNQPALVFKMGRFHCFAPATSCVLWALLVLALSRLY